MEQLIKKESYITKLGWFIYIDFPIVVLCSHDQLGGEYSWMTKTAKKFFWCISEKWIKEAES